ncbi:MAG: hypothetical protein HYW50_01220 [Candidatus Diapherotrites archaeon]|nr:hypothetical protein [Candidatus Diapherotrites archaeon]
MGIIKKLATAFFLGVAFFSALFIGNAFFPGKIFDSTFTTLGLLSVLIAIGLDALFNLESVD